MALGENTGNTMEIKSDTTLPPPTADRIKWFEKTYRVTLPIDYVEFLGSGNGGVPVENVFDANGRERVLESFLCILNDPRNDSVNGWRDITVVVSQLDERLIDDENLVGMNVIPIAVLFGGDFLCLDFRHSPDAPTIAVWDHEQSDEFSPHLKVIADSFTEFISQLKS
jgi:hypothetical protein